MSGVRNVLLKDICNFEKGSTGLMKAVPGEYPLVTTGVERRTCESYQFDTKAVCIPLVSSTGHGHASLNNVHYQEGRFALGSILVALTAKNEDEVDIHFLHLYLSQLKDVVLVPLMKGAANVSLSITAVKGIQIPLPTINRQREIVEKFKSIVNEENQLISELNKQQDLLTQLKNKIVDDAITGKLTHEWRKSNLTVDENANDLLKKIRIKKQQLISDKKIPNQKSLPPIPVEKIPFEVPENWQWCRLLDLCSKTGSGSTPSGGKTAYTEVGIKFIRSQNVYNEGLRLNNVAFIPLETHKKMSGTKVQSKDLLLNITGGSIGRCAIVPDDFDEGNINQHVAIIRNIESEVGKYLHKVIISGYFWKEIINSQTGAGREGLPKNKMDEILIPLPPLIEQKIIISKIDKVLSLCELLDSQLIANRINANQLISAVLKECFTQ